MKWILLENGFPCDIPEELHNYCERAGIEFEYYDMRQRFWPENRKETVDFFSNLPVGQGLICSTVFEDFQQLELMIELLYKLKDKQIEFRIMHGSLADDMVKWYNMHEADTCPYTEEYNDNPDLRLEHKQTLNKKFIEVLANHKIIWARRYNLEVHFDSLKTIENNVY